VCLYSRKIRTLSAITILEKKKRKNKKEKRKEKRNGRISHPQI
jgi:hypothetical protein